MYNYEFLHLVRLEEAKLLEKHLPKSGPILELGGGTGYQAKILSEQGYDIISLDLYGGHHVMNMVFPVAGYDGKTIPFPDSSFNAVFTSHTLECISDLDNFQKEIHRVLAGSGVVVHLVPSNWWELWTIPTGTLDILPRVWKAISTGAGVRTTSMRILKRFYIWMFQWKRTIVGSRVRNLIAWRKQGWADRFETASFEVVHCEAIGFLYTGNMLLGSRLSFRARRLLAGMMGSSAYLFVLKKRACSQGTDTELAPRPA